MQIGVSLFCWHGWYYWAMARRERCSTHLSTTIHDQNKTLTKYLSKSLPYVLLFLIYEMEYSLSLCKLRNNWMVNITPFKWNINLVTFKTGTLRNDIPLDWLNAVILLLPPPLHPPRRWDGNFNAELFYSKRLIEI